MNGDFVVQRTVVDVTPDPSEVIAEKEAENRLELLGVCMAHSKKPSNNRKVKEVKYGRGKTVHISMSTQAWKDFQSGKISVTALKDSKAKKAGKAPAALREKPEWMKKLELDAKEKNMRMLLKSS